VAGALSLLLLDQVAVIVRWPLLLMDNEIWPLDWAAHNEEQAVSLAAWVADFAKD